MWPFIKPGKIRHAIEGDMPMLCRIELLCFEGCYKSHRWGEKEFRRQIRRKNRFMFVTVMEGACRGYAAGRLVPRHGQLLAYLDSIAVVPGYQGIGLARRLLRRFVRESRKRGCHRVLLQVARTNARAVLLFKAAGFAARRTLRGYYGDVDGLSMVRALTRRSK